MKTGISTKPFLAFIILGITTILLSLTFQPAMGSSLEEAGDLSCAALDWPTPAPPDSGGSLDGGQGWYSLPGGRSILPGRETRTLPDYRPVEQATAGNQSGVLAQTASIDLSDYFIGNGSQYVEGEANPFYTFTATVRGKPGFYVVKSHDGRDWEEFNYDGSYIYHLEDTSWATGFSQNVHCLGSDPNYPNHEAGFTKLDNPGGNTITGVSSVREAWQKYSYLEGAKWVSRSMSAGSSSPFFPAWVIGFSEIACQYCDAPSTGGHPLTDDGGHQVMLVSVGPITFPTGWSHNDVARIAVISGAGYGENFFLARGLGLVAFDYRDPPTGDWDRVIQSRGHNYPTSTVNGSLHIDHACYGSTPPTPIPATPTPPPPTTPPPSGTITVSGTVKDTNGNRLTGIWVYFWEHGGAHSAYSLTDSNGHYSLQIAQGSLPYQVVANKDNSDSAHPKNFHYSTSAEVTITPDENHIVDFRLTPVASTPPPANHAPLGYLDAISSAGVAWGWALDPDTASANIQVQFYLDGPAGQGAYIGSARADLPRPDINRDLGYPGDHGFNFSIPSQYRDGRTHSLYAYGIDTAGGTNPVLSACPKYFTLGSSSGCPPSLTCGRVLDEYGNPEDPPSAGRRVTTAVQPGETRQAENYWGMMGIDYIGMRGRSGMCDPWRIYLFGWHGRDPNRSGNQKGDLAEYLVNFPSASSTYTFNVIGLPDDPKGEDGVLIGIWIDGAYKGRVKWNDSNPACNEGEGGNSQRFSITGYQGVHAVAFEFINDFYEPPFRDEFSRDMFFDYFKFTASASAPPTQPPPTQPPATQPPPTTSRAGLHILHPTSGVWPGMRITQCIENGKQRVWQVSSDTHWANWITDSESQDGYCGSADPTFGILPLIFRDSTYTPGGLVTWCTGASGTRWVWLSNGSYRYVPFAYPENSQGACP